MQNSTLRNTIAAIAVLFLATFIYFYPVIFDGQVIPQDDISMGLAKGKSIVEHRAVHGEEPLWTDRMFSGMPTFQISTLYPNNWLSHVQKAISFTMVRKSGIYIILSMMVGFFALLRSERIRPSLAVIGALALGFSAFFIISLSAGHNAKIRTAVYIAPLLMGVLLTLRGKHLLGLALTALFTGLSIHANHFQVTYYTAIPIIALVVSFGVSAWRAGEVTEWLKRCAILLVAAGLGIGPNIGNLWSSASYTQASMRGGHSALVENNTEESAGLEFDYAMSWSYGIGETWNLFIADAMGGGGKQSYEGTELYDLLRQNGQGKAQANAVAGQVMYHGEQSMVNGGYYMGAAVIFLFILGLFVVRGPVMWAGVATVLIALLMAWGKHMAGFNGFLFEHLPLFNKFRVPSMALVVAFVAVPWIGFLGLEKLLNMEREAAKKILIRATIVAAGLAGIFWLIGPSLVGTDGLQDARLAQSGFPMDVIEADRIALLRGSAGRSLMIVLAAAGAIYLYLIERVKTLAFALIFGAVVVGDLWAFDYDQLGAEDYMTPREQTARMQPTDADQRIMKDVDPHFRVYNTQAGLTSDSYTAAHHESIGGYHGAKLARYQDLIEGPLSAGKLSVFNMLNTKYFIVKGPQGPMEQVNFEALGHAWFPSTMRLVPDANGAMAILNSDEFNASKEVIYEADMIAESDAPNYQGTLALDDSSDVANLSIVKYKSNRIEYEVRGVDRDRLVVFSDIYYEAPGQEWTLTADGETIDIMRANYILRSAVIPAGTKNLVMSFEPKTYTAGENLNLGFSILLFLSLGLALWREYRSSTTEAE